MQPEATGQAVASAAVAMGLFAAWAVTSALHMLKTKCKLYEVLAMSALSAPLLPSHAWLCSASHTMMNSASLLMARAAPDGRILRVAFSMQC